MLRHECEKYFFSLSFGHSSVKESHFKRILSESILTLSCVSEPTAYFRYLSIECGMKCWSSYRGRTEPELWQSPCCRDWLESQKGVEVTSNLGHQVGKIAIIALGGGRNSGKWLWTGMKFQNIRYLVGIGFVQHSSRSMHPHRVFLIQDQDLEGARE
jgi:hypothetical protein